MTADRPGDRDDAEDRDLTPLERLVALLETIAEMDERGERRRDGHTRIGDASVDFSIGIGTLDDAIDAAGDRDRRDPRDRRRGADGDRRHTDDAAEPERAAHVDVRETAEGATVVADLPNVDESDVTATVDDEAGELQIDVRGTEAGRVPLSGDGLTITEASFNNHILEVELERTDSDS